MDLSPPLSAFFVGRSVTPWYFSMEAPSGPVGIRHVMADRVLSIFRSPIVISLACIAVTESADSFSDV